MRIVAIGPLKKQTGGTLAKLIAGERPFWVQLIYSYPLSAADSRQARISRSRRTVPG